MKAHPQPERKVAANIQIDSFTIYFLYTGIAVLCVELCFSKFQMLKP